MGKNFCKWAVTLVLLLSFLPLFGQLSVGLEFNRRRYMQYEHIYACVTIRNDSGRPLLFGSRPELQGYVLFDVRDVNGNLMRRRPGMEVSVQGLYLAPGEVKNMVIQLDKYYDMRKEGSYYVHAYVSHNLIRKEYRSRDQMLNVSAGAVIWKRIVGLPSVEDENAPRERIYSISKMVGDKTKYYYLRVEDNGKIYAVTRLGLVLSHMELQAHVDMLSRIHLLVPVAPKVYHYMSFNVDGALLEDSYWKTFGTVPMLYRNPKSGQVTRMGGAPAKQGVDYSDPKAGGLTIAEVLEDGVPETVRPGKDGGMVDLGKDILPMKAADED